MTGAETAGFIVHQIHLEGFLGCGLVIRTPELRSRHVWYGWEYLPCHHIVRRVSCKPWPSFENHWYVRLTLGWLWILYLPLSEQGDLKQTNKQKLNVCRCLLIWKYGKWYWPDRKKQPYRHSNWYIINSQRCYFLFYLFSIWRKRKDPLMEKAFPICSDTDSRSGKLDFGEKKHI